MLVRQILRVQGSGRGGGVAPLEARRESWLRPRHTVEPRTRWRAFARASLLAAAKPGHGWVQGGADPGSDADRRSVERGPTADSQRVRASPSLKVVPTRNLLLAAAPVLSRSAARTTKPFAPKRPFGRGSPRGKLMGRMGNVAPYGPDGQRRAAAGRPRPVVQARPRLSPPNPLCYPPASAAPGFRVSALVVGES
jgi:hypothetical protein